MSNPPKPQNRLCSKCGRILPPTAYFKNHYEIGFAKCRDCLREATDEWRKQQGQGERVGQRMLRAQRCPICCTLEARLSAHMRRWHGAATDLVSEDESPGMCMLLGLRSAEDTTASWGKEQRVYVIRAGGLGRPIKIGTSSDFNRRISEMQVHCPDVIAVLLTVRGDVQLETKVHAAMREWHLHGEWFQSDPEALDMLTQVMREHAQPVVLDAAPDAFVEYVVRERIETLRAWKVHRQSTPEVQDLPENPAMAFPRRWVGWEAVRQRIRVNVDPRRGGRRPRSWVWFTYEEAQEHARSKGVSSRVDWVRLFRAGELDPRAPSEPADHYRGTWRGWNEFLGLPGKGRGRPVLP